LATIPCLPQIITSGVTNNQVYWYWIRATIFTAMICEIVFLFLFKKLELGLPALFAQRGQSRVILAQAFPSMIISLLCLLIIRMFKLSGMLIFSALIMPLQGIGYKTFFRYTRIKDWVITLRITC